MIWRFVYSRRSPFTLVHSPFTTLIFFYKHGLFLAEPGKEIEIATSKLTTMCLKYWWFQPERAYKAVAYKKKKVYLLKEFWKKLVLFCHCNDFNLGLGLVLVLDKRTSIFFAEPIIEFSPSPNKMPFCFLNIDELSI